MTPTRRVRALLAVVLASALTALGLAVPMPASAATFTVNNCSDSGPGSLRQAVLDANTAGGGNTITFALSCSPISLTSGEILITNDLTINGPGAGALAVSAGSLSRVFETTVGTTVAISGLTIDNGNAVPSCATSDCEGGAIFARGTLTVTSSTLSGNTASCVTDSSGFCMARGGAISGRTLTVTDSAVSGNTVSCSVSFDNSTGSCDAQGAGIAAGAVTLTGTTLSGDNASCSVDSGGQFSNCLAAGGGIFASSSANVSSSTLSGNGASCSTGIFNTGCRVEGGGMDVSSGSGMVTVTDSTFSDNTTSSNSDGCSIACNSSGQGGGLAVGNAASLTLAGTTLSGNSVSCTGTTCTTAEGGGLDFFSSGGLTMTNSTVFDNSVSCSGSHCTSVFGGAHGGGVFFHSTVPGAVNSATLSDNSASCSPCAPDGGGVRQMGSTLTLTDTIVANSPSGGDCAGTITDGGFNLADDNSCGFTLVANPLLGPLANNGGPTFTMALMPGSPAIGAGDTCPAADAGVDQRGVPRKNPCDIGAYETLHHPTSTTVSCSPSTVHVDQPSTCTATVTDTVSSGQTTPTGMVTLTSTGPGTFSGSPCTLMPIGVAVASCSVTYTPSGAPARTDTITASYGGDSTHMPSTNTTTVSVVARSTTTTVSCVPVVMLAFGLPWKCTATVTDSGAGAITPTGTVAFTSSRPGRFTGSPCTLVTTGPGTAACSVTYVPSAFYFFFPHTITATYSGDAAHAPSSGTTIVHPWLWWLELLVS